MNAPATPLQNHQRSFRQRPLFPRYLFGLACLITLIILFYALENWRGKRAWEKCRRDLEAEGAVLDWGAYVPAPVPDNQNVFKAPRMQEWFVRGGAPEGAKSSSQYFAEQKPYQPNPTNLLLAVVQIVASNSLPDVQAGNGRFRLEDPATPSQIQALLDSTTGPGLIGTTGIKLVARSPEQIQAVRLLIESEQPLSTKAIRTFITSNLSQSLSSGHGRVVVETAGTNLFHITLSPAPRSAADYLEGTEGLSANINFLRDALQRPYARMEGDYQHPEARPIPNFITVRTVAQLLAQRTQSYLLLGQPEPALRELTTLHELPRLLHDTTASGKTLTLVAAMIDVAITGVYTATIADGLRLHAWGETQLASLQQQLVDIDLFAPLSESLQAERAGVCRFLETTGPGQIGKTFFQGGPNVRLWDKLQDKGYLLLELAPRGWVYRNMASVALLKQKALGILDSTNQIASPRKADELERETEVMLSHASPYTYLAGSVVPNFLKAFQTTAKQQAMASAALTACALERFRLAHGQYPDKLEQLQPQLIPQIPHDPIGGQPLKYRRTEDGQFLLYSIGWNEKDDGGVAGKSPVEGDWVWGASQW